MEAIAVLVARIFAAAVTDGLVLVAPHRQASVNAVLVGVDHRAFDDRSLNDRLDRFLLHIGQHAENDLAIALDQAQDRRLFLLQRATAARSFEPSAPPGPTFFSTAAKPAVGRRAVRGRRGRRQDSGGSGSAGPWRGGAVSSGLGFRAIW